LGFFAALTKPLIYHFKIHKQDKGFWAECLELEGCVTQGDDRKHLYEMMRDALAAYLDEPEDSKQVFPMPKSSMRGRNIVQVAVEPRVALALLVRHSRLQQHLTQKQAADKLGMKHLSQYQKLESGKTANPELTTLAKLKGLFPGLSLDTVFA
jgi:antitoxin HicB